MHLVHPSAISKIDKYAERALGIPTRTLMERAGRAVERAVREYVKKGAVVSIFAGKGNNGGDGYAAALYLADDYRVTVYEVFSGRQRSDDGRYFLNAFAARGGRIEPLLLDEKQLENITASDAIVDAVFGTGFFGDLPEIAVKLSEIFASLEHAVKIAVDVPLGIDAAYGRVLEGVRYRATATVVLGYIKCGLVSYPAMEYVGKLIYDNIGLQDEDITPCFTFTDHYVDRDLARELVPQRAQNSHKGAFGKLMAIVGSSAFPGAAHLSLEAALRSGVGYVSYLGEKALCDSLILKWPEAIYKPFSIADLTSDEIDSVVKLSANQTAILCGSGSTRSGGLLDLLMRLLSEDGAPLVLDADAINSLGSNPEIGMSLIRSSPRTVILTPHPMEAARLAEIPIDYIQNDRLKFAKDFASYNKCILVLKGAATIVTDGEETYINSSGSSALAKAGSGDVLAGHLAALVAMGMDPLRASALAVYLHGHAADILSDELSEFGVTPSDLPREIARCISRLVKEKE